VGGGDGDGVVVCGMMIQLPPNHRPSDHVFIFQTTPTIFWETSTQPSYHHQQQMVLVGDNPTRPIRDHRIHYSDQVHWGSTPSHTQTPSPTPLIWRCDGIGDKFHIAVAFGHKTAVRAIKRP